MIKRTEPLDKMKEAEDAFDIIIETHLHELDEKPRIDALGKIRVMRYKLHELIKEYETLYIEKYSQRAGVLFVNWKEEGE